MILIKIIFYIRQFTIASLITCVLCSVHAETVSEETQQDIYQQLSLFGDILERVRQEYVDAPQNRELIEAALTGMLSSLDPHSSYLSPKRFIEMQVHTNGKFGGLGIEVTMEKGLIKVIAPIAGTPAERAGVLPNDLIIKLNGQNVLGLSLSDAVDIMRGERGTDIHLTIIRHAVSQPLEITITRDIIHIQVVHSRMTGPHKNIMYIRLTTFNKNTMNTLKKAVKTLSKEHQGKNLSGYIIDLRNNPGGLLSQAIQVSDSFLSHGEIVSTRARNPKDNIRYHAKKKTLFQKVPLLVLINGGSASASEIVAGALQDHHHALIVGTKSFGKGSVQTIIPLPNEGALKLTTARYYTPSGKSIQARGIIPDIIIEQDLPETMKNSETIQESELRGHLKATENDINNPTNKKQSVAYVPREEEKDTQLQKAIQLIFDLNQSRKRLATTSPR